MKYLKSYATIAAHNADTVGDAVRPRVCAIKSDDSVIYHEDTLTPVYVEDLLSMGYAKAVTGSAGTYISILPTCPYRPHLVLDLAEVATNTKQITAGTNNIITWDEVKASGWKDSDIAAIYSGVTLGFTPRPNMFWAVGDTIDNFSVTFSGAEWAVNDYPWGAATNSNGTFAPRYDNDPAKEHAYNNNGFRRTPANVTVTISGIYSSVAQVMFNNMGTTTAFTLNCGGVFIPHDVVGMFEYCYNLETLTINGPFRWDTFRLMINLFENCYKLTSIPYVTSWGRDDEANAVYNTLFPQFDGIRGSACGDGMFANLNALTFLGPRLNMAAMSVTGCTYEGRSQVGAGNVFYTPELTNVRIINLNNCDWDFSSTDTGTYIPKMDVTSIEYLLNHVTDCSSNPHTVKFSALHSGQVSAAAISAAQAKGWTVTFESAE